MGQVKRIKKEGAIHMCGYCAMAPKDQGGPEVGHAHCYLTDGKNFRCACGDNDHKLTREIAEYMARYCHMPLDEVYARHDRKRRVLSPEQRVAASERLAKARAAKALKRPVVTEQVAL